MSNYNGPISSSDNHATFGVSTTSSLTWLLATKGDTIRVVAPRTPASSSANGSIGEICWDTSYIYVCTATNTWKRIALTTF
jgi:hypothetical protein